MGDDFHRRWAALALLGVLGADGLARSLEMAAAAVESRPPVAACAECPKPWHAHNHPENEPPARLNAAPPVVASGVLHDFMAGYR
jgi:hypothetical protein